MKRRVTRSKNKYELAWLKKLLSGGSRHEVSYHFKETIFTIGNMSSYFALLCTFSAAVFAAKPHHITIALSNISEAISWYEEHLDCQATG